MRWALSLVLALLLGVSGIAWITDGFAVLTSEAARRRSVMLEPRELPPFDVLVADGSARPFMDDLSSDGRSAIVNFFYTRCVSLCLAQGTLTQQLQEAIEDQGLRHRVRLISISFDPRDRAVDLARYAHRIGANEDIWQFMAFADPSQAARALDFFGIKVIPAPLGEFEHNAALHVVTAAGRLTRIVDLDEPGLALELARAAP